jgi:uncharacterized protein YjiS (DUF1127 family)
MKKLAKRISNYMEHYGRVKSRQILLNLSDRQLEDAGISKELLLQGTSAWPWRVAEEPAAPLTEIQLAHINDPVPAPVSDSEYQQAVVDLEGMSDRDLRDMGLTRGEIRYAVRFGVTDKAAA